MGQTEFGAGSPRQAGPEGADPETDARWRQASQVAPGYLVQDMRPGAGRWSVSNSRRLQGWASTGLMGPGSPSLRRQPQRGFSPVQGARLGVRDRPRQCSSAGSAIRRSQPRDRVQLCQPGRRSLPTSFPRGGVLRGQRGAQAILLPHQSSA